MRVLPGRVAASLSLSILTVLQRNMGRMQISRRQVIKTPSGRARAIMETISALKGVEADEGGESVRDQVDELERELQLELELETVK